MQSQPYKPTVLVYVKDPKAVEGVITVLRGCVTFIQQRGFASVRGCRQFVDVGTPYAAVLSDLPPSCSPPNVNTTNWVQMSDATAGLLATVDVLADKVRKAHPDLVDYFPHDMGHQLKAAYRRRSIPYRQRVDNSGDDTGNRLSSASMALNFGKSMVNWAKSGFRLVTANVYDSRLAICKGCEFWDKEALKGTGRCRKCGCSTKAKLKLASSKCPIDKWSAVI